MIWIDEEESQMETLKDDGVEDQEIIGMRKPLDSISQEDVVLTIGREHDIHTSTDNITGLEGSGRDQIMALMDHIVEVILFYEEKLRT